MDRLLRLALAPVLIAQAIAVRTRTVPLPEALGALSGTVGDGPPQRLLFVGDSSMAGVGVRSLDQALPGQVLQRLQDHAQVQYHIHARSSATTRVILRFLPPHPCDIAIVALGVNDITRLVPLARWQAQTEALVDMLTGLGARQVHLNALPPLDRFDTFPQPLRWTLARHADRMNDALRQLAAKRPEVTVHSLPNTPMPHGAIARDGFHPGPATYAHWGTLIAEHIRATWDAAG